MPIRNTKEIHYVRLPEKRIREIEELAASWPYETKAFLRARLNQYAPKSSLVGRLWDTALSVFISKKEKRFETLKDPQILTDWQRRFSISGKTNPLEAWNKVLEKEVSPNDYIYLLSLLDKELADVHLPAELEALFEKLYRAFIRKEYLSDPELPKAPLLLLVGPTGSGKTVTAIRAIEEVIFTNKVLPEIDVKQKREEILAQEPFWKTIEQIDPALSAEINRRKRLRHYKRLSKIPLLRSVFKKRIVRNLLELEEQGVAVDYALVTPNDYQTALAGEPGNYFKRAMGNPKQTSIRHIEEAHSAFGKAEGRQQGVERQQRTLIDTSNIIIDEITDGRRDCLLIATTDQPEKIDPAIYRRFVEKGKIIDISEFWKNPANLSEIVRLELFRNDITTDPQPTKESCPEIACMPTGDLEKAVENIYAIFAERALKITPAYVRKLIESVIEMKGGFAQKFLEEPLLVRKAFELVAKNSYGDLFQKVVGKMDRNIKWEEYIGTVKDLFSEMANNSLYYGVAEEKGVVLKGPPGSGKTFLVRSWLSQNSEVHDISASPSALQDPVDPVEGAVANLEKVYDIAKMIAPTMVFFDEGDSLAPKRSPSGGSPSDKLTNKFLNIIDGEVPLNKAFTVLTTNRIDILDPALIRSKRLKVMEISGHLLKDDIYKIVDQFLIDIPLGADIDARAITTAANGLCNTPADYAAFIEKVLSLRNTEYAVLKKFQEFAGSTEGAKQNFIKLNYKTLVGILDALEAPRSLRSEIKETPERFLSHFQEIEKLLSGIRRAKDYPLVASHLQSAKQEISESPTKKGKVLLDEFLEAELSQEPQVGFIVGVGANEVSGMLLPIATSLTFGRGAEKIMVTGAVSSSASAAAELEMAVQMTKQSAREALTLVGNYLQSILPRINIHRILGEFFQNYSFHHQLLSASYNVGGPSAGYALAINTLSAMLHIPVYNDFGITGAPWTKGVRKGEVGGSVIIGGHKKKTEKVLMHLKRMYMPLKNYHDLEQEYLVNYWRQNKDIVGVTHFGDLVPEVLWLGPENEKALVELVSARIECKQREYLKNQLNCNLQDDISRMKSDMRNGAGREISRRLMAIRDHLQDPVGDPTHFFRGNF